MPDRCRSCKALVIWAVSDAGRYMPFDRNPIDTGEWFFQATPPGQPPRAVHVPVGRRESLVGELMSPHWATCPHAGRHRRRRR